MIALSTTNQFRLTWLPHPRHLRRTSLRPTPSPLSSPTVHPHPSSFHHFWVDKLLGVQCFAALLALSFSHRDRTLGSMANPSPCLGRATLPSRRDQIRSRLKWCFVWVLCRYFSILTSRPCQLTCGMMSKWSTQRYLWWALIKSGNDKLDQNE